MKKARIIATGKIVEIVSCRVQGLPGGKTLFYNVTKEGDEYLDDSLDFNYTNNPDYWTRLEHQAAIAAMQGMLNNSLLIIGLLKVNKSHEDVVAEVTGTAIRYAHALVEKYKEKEERK